MTEPPLPPDGSDPAQTGEFADFFHTEDLPAATPRSHRGAIEASPMLSRLLAPVTAVVVVIVVILLLIWINGGSSGNQQSPAAVGPGSKPPVAATSHPPTSPPVTTSPPVRPTHPPTHTATPGGSTTGPKPHRSTPPRVPKHSTKPVPTAMAPVTVLNNSTRTGLAHEVAAEVQSKGWHIATVGNLQGLVPTSTVYYAAGDHAAAVHLAHDFASIARIEPNSAGNLHGSALTLVVTASWQL